MTTRAESYFEKIEQDMPAGYVFERLHWFFKNKKDIVLHLSDTAADDHTIQEFIGEVFGIYGGGSMEEPKGWYEYAGGKNPRLTFQDRNFTTTEELRGKRLIDTFRQLYKLPRGGQLTLFG